MSESKYDEKSGEENKTQFAKGELLMYVASDSRMVFESKQFVDFMEMYSGEWKDAVEGERSGEGSPIKAIARYKTIHNEYLEIMEQLLEKNITKNKGTLELFYADVRHALDGGEFN